MKALRRVFGEVFVRYFGSMVIGLVTAVILSLPIRIFVEVDSDLLNFALMLAAVVVSLFVLFFKDGYRNKRFKAKELLLSLLILFGSLLIVTYILKPAVYVSGPTNFLASYVLLKVNPGLVDGMAMLKRYIMELMVLAFVFVYSPIILLAEILGAKKHKKEFAAPTKGL